MNSNLTYILTDNILYKCFSTKSSIRYNDLFLVVLKEHIQDICKLYHSSSFDGHFESKKTKAKIKQQRFWWSNMDQEIQHFYKPCDLCQFIKDSELHDYNLSSTSKDFPFLRVTLDLFGSLPVIIDQNKYTLVTIDCFSRYVEIYPITSITQEELVKVFYNRFLLRHSVSQGIITDDGTPFNSMFLQLTGMLGSQNLFAPPYYPQSNGIRERFMSTLR